MWRDILMVLVISCQVVTASKVECRHDSQCGSDECCYYYEGPVVPSKKRQVNVLPATQYFITRGGWCESYKKKGEYCDDFSKAYGHCECGAGLECTTIYLASGNNWPPPTTFFHMYSKCLPKPST
ncbi:uncharacterized protein [Mytilus edulis]|uniref:uncharacterized protein n=1 Tax=Mytilus edulis TaxID=6550 RepID=UPI0039EE0CA7